MDVLIYIQSRLKTGTIFFNDKISRFNITKKSEFFKLFELLDIKPLNTTKILNYKAWRDALYLYKLYLEVPINNPEEIILYQKLIDIKNSMNKKRLIFNHVKPLDAFNPEDLYEEHIIEITPYWLLGFTEGDGSFNINQTLEPSFNITQTIKDRKVMVEIHKYLNSIPYLNFCTSPLNTEPFLEIGRISTESKEMVGIYTSKHNPKSPKDKRQDSIILQSSNSEFFIKYLIPFFDNLTFLSKKQKDYFDWKTIIELKRRGWNYDSENKKILLGLKNRMNNHRLSTNFDSYISNPNYLSESELNSKIIELLNKSNIVIQLDGRVLIKSKNRYLYGGYGLKIEAFTEDKSFKKEFKSIRAASIYFKISVSVISLSLKNNKPLNLEGKCYYFKRTVSDPFFKE